MPFENEDETMKSFKYAVALAALVAVASPALADGEAVVNTIGAGAGATLQSTNSGSVTNTGTFGALTNDGSETPVDTYVDKSGPTITDGASNKVSIASIGGAASASSDTVISTAGTESALTVANNLDASSLTATNSASTGTVGNAGTIYGATITAGGGNSMSIQSVGASAGMSSSTLYIP